MPVSVIHFNTTKPIGRGYLRRWRGPREPLNNFGDMLAPELVSRIVAQRGLQERATDRRLVTVGSIMSLTKPGDVVWGTGVNGKSMSVGAAPALDVRAVRGPRTAALLRRVGAQVPAVYGDPALLWSRYWTRQSYALDGVQARGVIVVPNYNDLARYREDDRVVSPRQDFHTVIGEIARSDFVCGSSLHAIVLAESFGIPARLIRSRAEPRFKYDDYYAGTGRPCYRAARSIEEAIVLGGEPAPQFDAEALLASFPNDLWVQVPQNDESLDN